MSPCDNHSGNSDTSAGCDYTRCPIKVDLDDLKEQVRALRASVDNLLTAFNGARGVIVTLKWLAGIAGGLAALWAAMHAGRP